MGRKLDMHELNKTICLLWSADVFLSEMQLFFFFAGDTHTSPPLTGDDNKGDKQLEFMQLHLIFVCHRHQAKPQQ